jgi:hypothetical protein
VVIVAREVAGCQANTGAAHPRLYNEPRLNYDLLHFSVDGLFQSQTVVNGEEFIEHLQTIAVNGQECLVTLCIASVNRSVDSKLILSTLDNQPLS